MRPFYQGMPNFIDVLNDMFNVGMPRIRQDRDDPDSPGIAITTSNWNLEFEDNGTVADTMVSCSLSLDSTAIVDGWSIFVNALSGTATINAATAGTTFQDNSTSKTVTAGNAALITCDGTKFRIFRFSAT